MNDELLNQLTALVRTAQAEHADAERWQQFQLGLARRGFGPLCSVENILSLIPDIAVINSLSAASWPREEVAPAVAEAPKSGKLPRRKLTQDDKDTIESLLAHGVSHANIAQRLGLAVTSVEKYLDQLADR